MGYAWTAHCDHEDCETIIDRGLDYCCGGMHEGETIDSHDGEHSFTSCGGYFCEAHLITLVGFDEQGKEKVISVCAGCAAMSLKEIGDYGNWPDFYVSPKGDERVVGAEISK